jgi:hypothetical protein
MVPRKKQTRMQGLTGIASWISLGVAAAALSAGVLPNNQWELFAVAYPPDRDVSVSLGGGEKTVTSRGLCKVKWQNDAASMEIVIENLPSAQEVGWPGRQYILWAIDEEKRPLNLGPVPLSGRDAKWKLRAPVRVFGLLVTAEQDPQAKIPSTAVALESLLPTDRYLVVPVKRISVSLNPIQG